jgi:hypothetical protein
LIKIFESLSYLIFIASQPVFLVFFKEKAEEWGIEGKRWGGKKR